jgi:hypothetical protein
MLGKTSATIMPHPGVHLIQLLTPDGLGGGPESFSLQVDLVEPQEIRPPAESSEIVSNAGAKSWVTETQDEVRFWTEDLALDLDLQGQSGHLCIANWLGWHNALRFLYFHAYLRNQGLLLHAAGIIHREKAVVFPGLSGAGKTTIVRNSPGKTVLSDEVTAVQLNSGREGVVACGTPFVGDWGGKGTEIAAPLQGLFFPMQSQANRVERLTPSETLVRLLPCIITFTTFIPRQRELVAVADRLAQAAPGYLLHFRPEQDLWRVIDKC